MRVKELSPAGVDCSRPYLSASFFRFAILLSERVLAAGKPREKPDLKRLQREAIIGIAIRQLPKDHGYNAQMQMATVRTDGTFHFSIGAPQPLDVPDQQIASTVGEREREEEASTFNQKPTVTGHPSMP